MQSNVYVIKIKLRTSIPQVKIKVSTSAFVNKLQQYNIRSCQPQCFHKIWLLGHQMIKNKIIIDRLVAAYIYNIII